MDRKDQRACCRCSPAVLAGFGAVALLLGLGPRIYLLSVPVKLGEFPNHPYTLLWELVCYAVVCACALALSYRLWHDD